MATANNLGITDRQKQLLGIIYDYIKNSGYPPSFEEMRERLSVVSNQSVTDLLQKLQNRQLIKKNEAGARSIALLPLAYETLGKPNLAAFLGLASAGVPIQTPDIDGEWETISGEITQLKGEFGIIKISGDSMINAGINDGDTVLVRKQQEFVSGDIVLAQMGDDWTVKRFMSEDKPPFLYLKPENPKYKNIIFFGDIRMKGKIISILKNNSWTSIS